MQAFFIGQCYWSWHAMQMHRAIEAPTRGSALCRNHTQQAALALPRGRLFLLSQRVPPELQLAYQSLGSAAAIRESFWCVNSFFWGWTVLRFARLVALTTQPRADVLLTSGL